MSPSQAAEVRVAELVELACRAPSVHNSQPWLWVVDGDAVTLFADHRRHLVHTDPDGRDLLLSCGAALHHLKVAAAAAGWEAEIRRFPNPANHAQLATVTFAARSAEGGPAPALELLLRRRTDRRATAGTPVAREHLDALLDVARPFGVVAFAVVSAPARATVLALLAEADAVQRRDPDYLRETIEWVDRAAGDGVPSTNLVRHPPASGDQGAGTRFPPGLLPASATRASESRDALLVLCTSSDDAASRLRAGEALSAVLLEAEGRGLAAVPLSQATEVDQVRTVLQAELLKDAACPQVLVHVGRPSQDGPPVQPTPRRPLGEVLCDPAHLPNHLGVYRR